MTDHPARDALPNLPLIGRERFLIDKLTRVLHASARAIGEYTPVWERRRGNAFEVRLGGDTVARVAIELDRLDTTDGGTSASIASSPALSTPDPFKPGDLLSRLKRLLGGYWCETEAGMFAYRTGDDWTGRDNWSVSTTVTITAPDGSAHRLKLEIHDVPQ